MGWQNATDAVVKTFLSSLEEKKSVHTLHLFAGAGGGILADFLLGHRCAGAVEIDPFCQKTLRSRMADKSLPWFPVWDDVRTFDGKIWKGMINVLAGGFPCQDLSLAGKGAGIKEGTRSGLWFEFARIIGEMEPPFVWIENVPAIRQRGLDVVLGDLVDFGYDARWGVISAANAGAPHLRKRFWCRAERQPKRGRVPSFDALARWNPTDRLWEERAPFETDAWMPFRKTFPVWGMVRDGQLFHPSEPEFPALAEAFWPTPEGNEPEAFWPTPDVPNGGRSPEPEMGPTGKMPDGSKRQVHLHHKVELMESGLWPTPRSGKMTDENEESWMKRHEDGKVATPPLALAVKMAGKKETLPTPTKYDSTPGGPNNHYKGVGWMAKTGNWPTPTKSTSTIQDMEQARFSGNDPRRPEYSEALPEEPNPWPTPRAADADRGGRGDLLQAVRGNQNPHGKNWPTPMASSGSARVCHRSPSHNEGHGKNLGSEVLETCITEMEEFGTPTASMKTRSEEFADGRMPNPKEAALKETEFFGTPLAEDSHGHQQPGTLPGSVGCNGGQLNPAWVEWLMGWPVGWTDQAPLNQAWFAQWKDGTGPWTEGFWWDRDPSRTGFSSRVEKNVPDRVSRLAALGNGQVPATAALAWTMLVGFRENSPSLDEIFGW